jgi:periplasmic protein TonB
LTIKKFILFSVIIHISFFVGLYFAPEGVKKKPEQFIASLVSPEELSKPSILPSLPPPPVVQKSRPLRLPPTYPVLPPRPPAVVPAPDKPLVPGMGKESGKQLPEGISPGPGKSEKPGEGLDARTRPGPTNGETRSDRSGVSENDRLSDKPGYLDRARLFDKGVIGDSARKEVTGSQKKKDDSITFDTSDYRYAGYMRKLKEKIESIWVYPPEAAAKGLVGDLRIRFTIRKDGTLANVELERTSGNKMLDDAAMKALKDGEPYWPIPDSWGMDSYTVPGHFIYSMYGYSLR